ncbi:MAG TPA: carboxylesterase/lipase family protein, partial [Humibacillus xanthopallidus]|nr:carboxylesterase/lipase family protein [Humibacillus xanthopallidus]
AQRYAARLASAAGITPDRAGFASLEEAELLACQDSLGTGVAGEGRTPFDQALAPARDLVVEGLGLGPVVDGELVRTPTLEAYRAGVGRDVPLVLGATDDEFSLLIHGVREPLDAVSGADALAALGLAGPTLAAYLETHADCATSDLVGRYVTDRLFRSATLEVLAARGSSRSWLYRFAWPSPVFGDAVHCLDVPFWFD